jgi:hypothetical protein
MHITFTWQKKEYEVVTYDISLGTAGRLKDAEVHEINLTLRGNPEAGAFKDVFEFAADQESAAAKSEGSIVVKPAKEKQSIKEISIKYGYFASVTQVMGPKDEHLFLKLKMYAPEVSISKNKFENKNEKKIVSGE